VIGRSLGPYRVDERLGSGGNGTVYRAEDARTRAVVALKFPHPALVQTPAGRERWIAGARATVALDHPHIVRTYELAEIDGEVFVAMELVGRRTLRDRLEAGPALLRETLAIGRAMAEALAHAHERGVAHGDLKPDNVLLGAQGVVKVADFGSPPPPRKGLGSIEVTVDYVAPETLAGDVAGPSADLYALGVVLYEMTTGHPPYSAASMSELLGRIASAPPVLPAAVPTALQELIEALLARRPGDRPASARSVIERLVVMGA
jgi:eukaryotic-like serine/threonine-protein kinase